MNIDFQRLLKYLFALLAMMIVFSCQEQGLVITNNDLVMEYNNKMLVRIANSANGSGLLMDDFSAAEYISGPKFSSKEYDLTETTVSGNGQITKYILKGTARENDFVVEKTVEVTVDEKFPGLALTRAMYVNKGEKSIKISSWVNNHYEVKTNGDEPDFWSFQASSSSRRMDWIIPVTPGFHKDNFMGMNNSDYGGGIPVANLWKRDGGIMVGHTELTPKLVSLPVDMHMYENRASLAVRFQFPDPVEFLPEDTITTISTFVSVHQGDFYAPLQQYSSLMQNLGIRYVPSQPEAFESVWCSWGYGENFTFDEVIATLPKVKEMGIKWIDLDHGFQIAEGDWDVDPERFPGGNANMKRFMNTVHSMGMRAKLWWNPLAVDMGTELLERHPDILITQRDGSPQYITFWSSFSMSPTYGPAVDFTREVVRKFIGEWGFDGLKLDGMNLNSVAPNYNRRHRLSHPNEDNEKLPDYFQMIYDETIAIKPDAVVQNCPCGCAISFYNISSMNQAVSSDPTSSFQIRHKGKTYKAINQGLAYYGDHVELSDDEDDFGTQFGIGSVLGTKFTWPENPDKPNHNLLTPEKESIWKKWFALYNSKMLSREPYLGELYDIGYDKPETHVIQKGDTLYYAFYADQWTGEIEFRGLKAGQYKIRDYVNDIDVGTIHADNPWLQLEFTRNLLVEVWPAE